jgi:hypothetical protein
MERTQLLNTALILIRDGRFHSCEIRDIAFYARVSERRALHYFNTTETLLAELTRYVRAQTDTITETALQESHSFEQAFFSVWTTLFNYYREQPEIMTFMEYVLTKGDITGTNDTGILERLISFFKENKHHVKNRIQPETIAFIFQSSIITAAKLFNTEKENFAEHANGVARILWDGIADVQPHNQTNAARLTPC